MTDDKKLRHSEHVAIVASQIYCTLLMRNPYNSYNSIEIVPHKSIMEKAVELAVELDRLTIQEFTSD